MSSLREYMTTTPSRLVHSFRGKTIVGVSKLFRVLANFTTNMTG